MSTFAQPTDVRNAGNLPASITDGLIGPQIAIAKRDIVRMIGQDNYDLYVGYNGSSDEEQQIIFDDIKQAEANLTMYYLIPVMNIQTAGSGIVRVKGWDQSRSEILSGSDVESLQDHFKEVAMGFLTDYLLPYTGDPNTEEDDDDLLDLDEGISLISI